MNEILTSISYILGIVLSCSAIVNYIVIRPLRMSIEALRASVDDVKLSLKELTKSNRALENRIIICEQNFTHYEKRLSKLEDFIFNKEA
jgi:hypothetical protein